MAAMEEIPRYEKNEKTKKGQTATANWENPRRTHASIISKYSTLCNSPISSTKNSFSTSHPKNRFKKKNSLPHINEDP
jgi:hypothetical protein